MLKITLTVRTVSRTDQINHPPRPPQCKFIRILHELMNSPEFKQTSIWESPPSRMINPENNVHILLFSPSQRYLKHTRGIHQSDRNVTTAIYPQFKYLQFVCRVNSSHESIETNEKTTFPVHSGIRRHRPIREIPVPGASNFNKRIGPHTGQWIGGSTELRKESTGVRSELDDGCFAITDREWTSSHHVSRIPDGCFSRSDGSVVQLVFYRVYPYRKSNEQWICTDFRICVWLRSLDVRGGKRYTLWMKYPASQMYV